MFGKLFGKSANKRFVRIIISCLIIISFLSKDILILYAESDGAENAVVESAPAQEAPSSIDDGGNSSGDGSENTSDNSADDTGADTTQDVGSSDNIDGNSGNDGYTENGDGNTNTDIVADATNTEGMATDDTLADNILDDANDTNSLEDVDNIENLTDDEDIAEGADDTNIENEAGSGEKVKICVRVNDENYGYIAEYIDDESFEYADKKSLIEYEVANAEDIMSIKAVAYDGFDFSGFYTEDGNLLSEDNLYTPEYEDGNYIAVFAAAKSAVAQDATFEDESDKEIEDIDKDADKDKKDEYTDKNDEKKDTIECIEDTKESVTTDIKEVEEVVNIKIKIKTKNGGYVNIETTDERGNAENYTIGNVEDVNNEEYNTYNDEFETKAVIKKEVVTTTTSTYLIKTYVSKNASGKVSVDNLENTSENTTENVDIQNDSINTDVQNNGSNADTQNNNVLENVNDNTSNIGNENSANNDIEVSEYLAAEIDQNTQNSEEGVSSTTSNEGEIISVEESLISEDVSTKETVIEITGVINVKITALSSDDYEFDGFFDNDGNKKTSEENYEIRVDGKETSDIYLSASFTEKGYEFFEEETVDDCVISVSAPKGVFPKGSTLNVTKIEPQEKEEFDDAIKKVRDDDNKLSKDYTFDIKIIDENGEEIQPDSTKGKVTVKFSMVKDKLPVLFDDVKVYHLDDEDSDTASKMTVNSGTNGYNLTATVETTHFSIYTVEFYYGDLEYVLEGDTSIKLSAIQEVLGLEGEVTSAVFSDLSLVEIGKDEDDEYILTALKPFLTEELLTLTIEDEIYEVKVTDSVSYMTVYLDTKFGSIDSDTWIPDPDRDYVYYARVTDTMTLPTKDDVKLTNLSGNAKDDSVEFAGWYTDINASGDAVTSVSYDAEGDVEKIYYAKWVLKKTTSTSSSMYYNSSSGTTDIRGYDTNVSGNLVKVTFSDAGFKQMYSYNGASSDSLYQVQRSVGSDIFSQLGSTGVYFAQTYQFEGSYVIINTILENRGSGDVSGFKFGQWADVQIHGDDRATVSYVEENGAGYITMSESSCSSGEPHALRMYVKGANYGVTDVTTYWFGYYGNANNNVFNQVSTSQVSNLDSGMSWSWTMNIPAGDCVIKTVKFGIGSKEALEKYYLENLVKTISEVLDNVVIVPSYDDIPEDTSEYKNGTIFMTQEDYDAIKSTLDTASTTADSDSSTVSEIKTATEILEEVYEKNTKNTVTVTVDRDDLASLISAVGNTDGVDNDAIEEAKDAADDASNSPSSTQREINNSYAGLVEAMEEQGFYLVKYLPNGGNWDGSSSSYHEFQKSGTTITIKTAPTKDGYEFNYYTCGDANYNPGESYTVTGAVTFSAIYNANSYTVKFNANGGSGEMEDQAFVYDVKQNLNTNTFTNGTSTFGGWARSSSSTEVEFDDGEQVTNLTTEKDGVVNLYAFWGYMLTINYKDSNNNILSTYKKAYSQNASYSVDSPSITGYHLKNTSDSTISGTIIENKEIDVTYDVNTYTIVFYPNNSNATGTMDSIVVNYGETITLPENGYSIEGTQFLGWANSANAENIKYSNGATVSNLTFFDGVEVPMYALWGTSVVIKYVDEDGNEIAPRYEAEITKGDSYSVDSPEIEGYTLMYSRQATISGTATDSVNVTVTYTANSYSVTFDSNGGLGEMEKQSFVYGTEQALSANTFTKDGATFEGWALSADATEAKYTDGEQVLNLTSENGGIVTLYAVWKKIPLIPSINTNNNNNNKGSSGGNSGSDGDSEEEYSGGWLDLFYGDGKNNTSPETSLAADNNPNMAPDLIDDLAGKNNDGSNPPKVNNAGNNASNVITSDIMKTIANSENDDKPTEKEPLDLANNDDGIIKTPATNDNNKKTDSILFREESKSTGNEYYDNGNLKKRDNYIYRHRL